MSPPDKEKPGPGQDRETPANGAIDQLLHTIRFVVDELGQAVFPCHGVRADGSCTCRLGADCKNKGKHPLTPRGHKDASRDWDVINGWVAQHPGCNWAMAFSDGLFAVDVDPRNGGDLSWAQWVAENGVTETLTSITGGGGNHYFLRSPDGTPVDGRKNWRKGVDVKSSTGYVMLAGSRHELRTFYSWREPKLPVATAPLVLIESIQKRASEPTVSSGDSMISGFPEGSRDQGLFELACRLRRKLGDDREAVTVVVLQAAANCDPPFDRAEALGKVKQAFRQDHPGPDTWMEDAAANLGKPRHSKARLRQGGSFILDLPDKIPALWGDGDRVLWAEGEGLMIAGQQGVGKTTIAQQLVLHRLGLRDGDLLGQPVALSTGRVLYMAMDRPFQAARSFRRMVGEQDRDILDARLDVWAGPLEIDPMAKNALADLIEDICPGVDTVVVDSVKDLTSDLSDPRTGAALNSAWQELIARDIQLLLLHHSRKAGAEGKRGTGLDDIFGSTWLTSGLGSVLIIKGEPGDPTVELLHRKQPAEVVGPLTVRHEHMTGTSTVLGTLPDAADLVRMAGSDGVTAEFVADTLFGRSGDAEKQKAARQLNKLVTAGLANKVPGARTNAGALPTRWVASTNADWATQWS